MRMNVQIMVSLLLCFELCSCKSISGPTYLWYQYQPQGTNSSDFMCEFMVYPERVEYIERRKMDAGVNHIQVVEKKVVCIDPASHYRRFIREFGLNRLSSKGLAEKLTTYDQGDDVGIQFMIDGEYSALSFDIRAMANADIMGVHRTALKCGQLLFKEYPQAVVTSTQLWEKSSVDARLYTVDEISTNALRLVGKRASVVGYYVQSLERSSLSAVPPSARGPYPYAHALWIGSIADGPESTSIDKLLTEAGSQGRWLRVEGTVFSKVIDGKMSAGHLGLWPASLTCITKVEKLSAPSGLKTHPAGEGRE